MNLNRGDPKPQFNNQFPSLPEFPEFVYFYLLYMIPLGMAVSLKI
jgi:hypothetical protein